MEIGVALATLSEGLSTRWRPLYDDYAPVRPRLLRRSAVPSPEPPTTPAIAKLWKQFAQHGQAFYRPSGTPLSKLFTTRPSLLDCTAKLTTAFAF
jgi:hypothetical protein